MAWQPIVGKSFRADQLAAYLEGLDVPTAGFKPLFVVLHNTAEPKISEWHSVPGARRMSGLVSYYRDTMHWSAGPHFFVADDLIWAFTPVTHAGVHAPSWNRVSIGVEMVGDYSAEPFDSGAGANVAHNAIELLAALHVRFGLDTSTLKFHKEDPKTTHKGCPGANVVKDQVVARLHARVAQLRGIGD